MELISLHQAAEQGIERVRLPNWTNPLDHIKIDIIDGKLGPWLKLYSPINLSLNNRDPVTFCVIEADPRIPQYVAHTGPTHDSVEYLEAQSRFLHD